MLATQKKINYKIIILNCRNNGQCVLHLSSTAYQTLKRALTPAQCLATIFMLSWSHKVDVAHSFTYGWSRINSLHSTNMVQRAQMDRGSAIIAKPLNRFAPTTTRNYFACAQTICCVCPKPTNPTIILYVRRLKYGELLLWRQVDYSRLQSTVVRLAADCGFSTSLLNF